VCLHHITWHHTPEDSYVYSNDVSGCIKGINFTRWTTISFSKPAQINYYSDRLCTEWLGFYPWQIQRLSLWQCTCTNPEVQEWVPLSDL
jgi:hypothetical protein